MMTESNNDNDNDNKRQKADPSQEQRCERIIKELIMTEKFTQIFQNNPKGRKAFCQEIRSENEALFSIVQDDVALKDFLSDQMDKKHQMAEKLMEKNTRIIQQQEDLAKRQVELAEKQTTIVQFQEELAEQHTTIVQQDTTLLKLTIAGLLQLTDSSRLVLTRTGTTSSHYQTKHEEAEEERKLFQLNPVPSDPTSELWGELWKDWKNNSSCLLGVSTDKGPMRFSHEADIQTYVHAAVVDAVYMCNTLFTAVAAKKNLTFHRLSHRREASLLSVNKPDHTVIYDPIAGVDILTIEDKKPMDKIEEKPKVLGQVFDFLSALAAVGHPNPFGILTTFEKTWVGWIHEQGHNIAASADRFNLDHLSDIVRRLSEIHGNQNQNSTPPPPTMSAPEVTNDYEIPLKPMDRHVFISNKSFDAFELVPVLFNAIICGLENVIWTRKIGTLTPGIHIKGSFLQLTTDEYDWVKGTLPVSGNPARHSWFFPHKAFTVVQLLGVGETSRAFRAVTENGDECVVKMYIRMFVDNAPLTQNKFKKAASSSVTAEVKRYHKIYPNLIPNVWWTILNGFYCVIHPFFKACEDREGSLESIKTVLKDNFVRHGYRFADSDIRWRHVGMLGTQVYLFDLADLVDLKKDPFENYITHHYGLLQGKVRTEQQFHHLADTPLTSWDNELPITPQK